MKILMVRMWPYELDINNYNCQETGLAKALISKGHTCDIVLYTDGAPHTDTIGTDVGKPITIYYLNAKNILKNAFYGSALYKLIDDYDIIQTSEYDQIANTKLLKKAKGKIVIYHGPYKSEFTKGYKIKCIFSDLYFAFHKKYKKTACIAKSILAEDFLKSKGFGNVTTAGVGLDTKRFSADIQKNDIIEKLETKKQTENLKYILYIGKIEERRSVLMLIEAFKKAAEKDPSVHLVIVGKGEKEYMQNCFDYIKQNNLSDKITYIESLPNEQVKFAFKMSDIFLLPTQWVIKHKFLRFFKDKKYSMYELPIVRDYENGKVTKEDLDKLSTCDMNAVVNDGLSDISREQLKNKTGEEIVDADIASQQKK